LRALAVAALTLPWVWGRRATRAPQSP